MKRCEWCLGNKLMMDYHDREWGVPVHDDKVLFEFLTLEGAQAGLSWLTILNKRENYRKAFDGFDVEKISKYTDKKKEELLANAGIVRNKLKISSTITNAQAFIKISEEFGSFDSYLWGIVSGEPIVNEWKSVSELPTKTKLSDMISADLRKRGFKFVGSTIIYSFMEAVGLINDHVVDCFRYKEIVELTS